MLLSTDAATGGWIVGGIFTMSCFLAVAILLSKLEFGNGAPIMFTLGFGVIFSVMVSWWPTWALIAAILFLLVGAGSLLGSRGD